jgi:hypothetical protein
MVSVRRRRIIIAATTLLIAGMALGKANMKVSEIYQHALPVLAGILSDSTRQGLPLPVRRDGTVRLAVLVAPVVIGTREGTAISVPTHLGEFDLGNGQLIRLRAVKPEDFRQATPSNGRLGFYHPEISFERTAQLREELFADLDVLIPAFANNQLPPGADAVGAVRRFRQNFQLLREEPLDPYYRAVGAEFFAWLDHLSELHTRTESE